MLFLKAGPRPDMAGGAHLVTTVALEEKSGITKVKHSSSGGHEEPWKSWNILVQIKVVDRRLDWHCCPWFHYYDLKFKVNRTTQGAWQINPIWTDMIFDGSVFVVQELHPAAGVTPIGWYRTELPQQPWQNKRGSVQGQCVSLCLVCCKMWLNRAQFPSYDVP